MNCLLYCKTGGEKAAGSRSVWIREGAEDTAANTALCFRTLTSE
jgi:hypothetical protein